METLPARGSIGMAHLLATGSEGTGSLPPAAPKTMFCRDGESEATETTGSATGNGASLPALAAIAVATVMGGGDTACGAGIGGVAAVATGS